MSAAKRRTVTRVAILACWLILALLVVGPVLAQDGEGAAAAEGTAAGPDGLDELAARLAPLLVGAALIERTLEFLFNWVERAILDCSHYLHAFAARITGLVTVDLRKAWGEWNTLVSALIAQSKVGEAAVVGNPESADPNDWPLEKLEQSLIEARQKLEAGQAAIQKAMDSPVYVARKRMAANWLSMFFGILLAAFTGLRLFSPLGMNVPDWFDGPFDVMDMALAGLLMGLGTEWVHQVIGLLIQGKGLLGRAGTGQNLDAEQVRNLTSDAVRREFSARLDAMLPDFLQGVVTASAMGAIDSKSAASLTGTRAAGLPSGSRVADVLDDAPPAEAQPAPEADPVPPADAEAEAEVEPLPAPVTLPRATTTRRVVPLRDTTVTVRREGAVVRRAPDSASQKLGDLRPGEHRWARGVVWHDQTWLQIPWDAPDVEVAWIPAEQTDFLRSRAYSQVSGAWYESDAVLEVRRALVRDLLRVRSTAPDRMEQAGRLTGEALIQLEQSLARQTMMPEYVSFWALQGQLGLPDPFVHMPVQPAPPATITQMDFYGFGPNSYAAQNWQLYYEDTRGLHTGVDYIVPEGSPLIAVCDGVIESAPSPDDPGTPITLRPYLPARYRNDDGSRQLSNVVVQYEHLAGDPTSQLVLPGDEVSAGEIIGTSGWPVYMLGERAVVQRNNPHLHVAVYLITDGEKLLGRRYPFNPLLFWSPRFIALQARLASQDDGHPYPIQHQPYGRLGFFSVGVFDADPGQPAFWEYQPEDGATLPPGVYNLEMMVEWLKLFEPYVPADYQSPAKLEPDDAD